MHTCRHTAAVTYYHMSAHFGMMICHDLAAIMTAGTCHTLSASLGVWSCSTHEASFMCWARAFAKRQQCSTNCSPFWGSSVTSHIVFCFGGGLLVRTYVCCSVQFRSCAGLQRNLNSAGCRFMPAQCVLCSMRFAATFHRVQSLTIGRET